MSTFDYYKLMEEIATGLAHEVKNPLALIIANIGLLELYDTKNCHEKNYKMMRREIERINNLLLSFIKFAKPEEITEKDFASLSLCEILNELMDTYKELYQNIEFVFTCKGNEINIFGDIYKIRQVIANILKNAIESIEDNFIEENFIQEQLFEKKSIKKKGTIKIDISLNREYTVLSILDSGKGISEEETEKVFKPFYTTKSGGSGLGLHLCKSIIGEHNGILEITGKVVKGCLVTIKLPNLSMNFGEGTVNV